MTTDAAKFSVLWEDQGSQDKHAMHITGFDGEQGARRFALDQREKGMNSSPFSRWTGCFAKIGSRNGWKARSSNSSS